MRWDHRQAQRENQAQEIKETCLRTVYHLASPLGPVPCAWHCPAEHSQSPGMPREDPSHQSTVAEQGPVQTGCLFAMPSETKPLSTAPEQP